MVDLENLSNQDYLLFEIELPCWLELLGFELEQAQAELPGWLELLGFDLEQAQAGQLAVLEQEQAGQLAGLIQLAGLPKLQLAGLLQPA